MGLCIVRVSEMVTNYICNHFLLLCFEFLNKPEEMTEQMKGIDCVAKSSLLAIVSARLSVFC